MEEQNNMPEETPKKEKKKLVHFSKKSIFLFLAILLVIISFFSYSLWQKKQAQLQLEHQKREETAMQESQTFSIFKIYCYSSGAGSANTTNKPQWDLAISQYTDIAIYIQPKEASNLTQKNTIQKLAVYDISISNNEEKKADLYFKDLTKFGTFDNTEENRIEGTLNYEVINAQELDYSKPQIYIGANNPITLQYARKAIKDHYLIKDLSEPIQFNGQLLQQANIPMSALESTLSFKIQITNQLNQEFVADIKLPIPLADDSNSIYSGHFVKEYVMPSIVFHRTK